MGLPQIAVDEDRAAEQSRQSTSLFEIGLKAHRAGRLAEAESAYRLALEAEPDNVAVPNNLGMIVPVSEQAALFRRALAMKPDFFEAHVNLARFLATQADTVADSIAHYQRAVALRTDWLEGYFAVGCLFQQRGQLIEAAENFQRCVQLKPDYVPAIFHLACTFALAGLVSKDADKHALTWFKRTVDLAPDMDAANFHLARLLDDAGRFPEAQRYRDRVSRPCPLVITPAPEHQRSLLIISTPSSANTPFRNLLPDRVNSLIIWHIDYATDQQQATLPPYDLAFNALGNADWNTECLARAASFARVCPRPLLNSPERVARTRRDLMPQLLADIPDVAAAPVLRLSREEIKAGLTARLEKEGISFPLIVRPFVQQSGVGMTLIESAADLGTQSFDEAEFYYFIQYCDYRSNDGYFRKYRTVFVDRQPHHYHLAISKNWLVHYFSADMLAEAWKRDEERRFLENPVEALGPRAIAAVAAIGERLDMDFAGIDYTVLADGRVFVFEANATMAVYFPEEPEYSYKTAYVQAMLTDFEAMMERKIETPRAPKPRGTAFAL
jgi:tetratricopeptide (TPR) repeat protein